MKEPDLIPENSFCPCEMETHMSKIKFGDPALRAKREISLRFTLDQVGAARFILMRNGEELDSKSLFGPELSSSVNELFFEDCDDLESVALRDTKFHKEPFVVYYLRIEDREGSQQWTSPIWIDLD